MAIEKKIFAGGGMDMDTDERFMAKTDYKKAVNCRISKTDEGNDGIVENIRSNLKRTNPPIDDGDICIGTYEDKSTESVIFFIYAADGNHGIYRRLGAGNIQTILQDPILNFSWRHLVTGVNVVGSDEDKFPDGLLYWTDDYNPPRKINIDKALTSGYSFITETILDAIKHPPQEHPRSYGFVTDSNVPSNQLKSKSWQFKYRWVYDDGEKSSWSPISPNYIDTSFSAYYNDFGDTSYENNAIPIRFMSGSETVARIQIASRNTNGIDDFLLIADIDKVRVNELVTAGPPPPTYLGELSLPLVPVLGDNASYYLVFYNNGIYSTIDSVESNKLYNDVPHLAKAQEIVDGNIIVYGNVVSGQTVDNVVDISLSPGHLDENILSENVSSVTLPAISMVETIWSDWVDPWGGIRERKCRFRAFLRWEINDVPSTCNSIYHLEVEDVMFGGLVNGYPGINNPHLSILNINFTSSMQATSTAAATVANNIVAELNTASSSEFDYNNIQGTRGSWAGYSFTGFLHSTHVWSVVTSGGTTYVQLKLETEKTPGRLPWSDSGAGTIWSTYRLAGFAYPSGGLGGYQSNWIPLNGMNYVSQFLDRSAELANSAHAWVGQKIQQNTSFYTLSATHLEYYLFSNQWFIDQIASSNGWFMYTPGGISFMGYNYTTSSASDYANLQGVDSVNPEYVNIYENLCAGKNFKAIHPSFKTGAKHRFGLVYYDRGNRSSSVKLGKTSEVYIPKTSETVPSYFNTTLGANTNMYSGTWHIDWEINHAPPDWATHYQWVYGGNTLTDSFLQFVTDGIYDGVHAMKNSGKVIPTTGVPISSGTYANNVLIDITNIRKFQEGESGEVVKYNFKEGDMLRFVLDEVSQPSISASFEFPIVGVAGERDLPSIIHSETGAAGADSEFDNKDFLVLARETALTSGGIVVDPVAAIAVYKNYTLEIYSPKSDLENDAIIYNEFSNVGYIYFDPATGTKIHSRILTPGLPSTGQAQIIDPINPLNNIPAKGTFLNGDVYYRLRNSKSDVIFTPVESFHYSDTFKSNYWNKGRPNAVLEDFKRTRKHSTCLYSESYIPNTNINGLSSFFPDVSFQEFERDYNSIQKLHSKDNKLIIFQEDKVSQSLVNRNVLYNIDGSGNVATSDSVLSQAVPYLGNYGINKNPESFAAYGNSIYFTDVKRGGVLRLGNDGFTIISNYKMKNFFTDAFKSIQTFKSGAFHKIVGVYDVAFDEYIVSQEGAWSQKLEQDKDGNWVLVNDKNVIPSWTLGFCEASNRWNSFYSYIPEMMCATQNGFVSFDWGQLYTHNISGTYLNVRQELKKFNDYNKFYGVEYDSELWVVSNEAASNNKIYKAFSQETDDIWDVTFDSPNGQQTVLLPSDFDTRENIHYSDIMNDVNSPGGLIEGDRMRDVTLLAKLKLFSKTLTRVFGVNFNFSPSERSNK